MAIMDISIIPVGTETPSVSSYVARAVSLLKDAEGLEYKLTAMGTIVAGPLPRLLDLAQKMHNSAFDSGAARVVTVIKIDERRDRDSTISGKEESVQRKLN